MGFALGLFAFLLVLNTLFITFLCRWDKQLNANRLHLLFLYHYALWAAYMVYALDNPTDSLRYFYIVDQAIRGSNWMDYYGVSTPFVEFFAFPLVHYFDFTYAGLMVFFAYLGYLGFVCFFLFFSENLRFDHQFAGIAVLDIVFFLPNTHFWSVSLGKGSLIFFALGLFFFGISRWGKRWLFWSIGGAMIYFVRPHVMFIIVLAGVIGFITSSGRINLFQRLILATLSLVVLLAIYQDILVMVGLEENTLESSLELSRRASELTKARSAVDITSYGLPMKLFTFWFRPLFLDAPGIFGLLVSVENLIYLLLILKFLRWDFIRYILQSDFLAKIGVLTFIGISIPLAQLAGNMGLALRQKSMIMILFFFVMLYYLDAKKWEKHKRFIAWGKRKMATEKMRASG